MDRLSPHFFGRMASLWSTIRPLLLAVDAHAITEVGSDTGLLTRLLVGFFNAHEGRLQVIDTYPLPEEVRESAHGRELLTFHRDTSLRALPRIGACDAVLIDGDHNWYTVYHELMLIDAHCRRDGMLPLILLHDVGWPYDRRDLYYDPQTIPDAYLHPHARAGLSTRDDALHPDGMNAHLHHALHYGGKRNGVLTAVEDWILQAREECRFVRLPGIHGLGIIASASLLDRKPALRNMLDALEASPSLHAHLEAVERDRLALQSCMYGDGNTDEMHARFRAYEEQARVLERRLQASERAHADLQHELAHMRNTKSWKMTRPLRTIEKALRTWLSSHIR